MRTVACLTFATLAYFHGACAFIQRPSPSGVSISIRVSALKAATHTGIRCDCCSAEPIQGLRFACLNVADVNICQSCANLPGQSFSAGGNPFIGLQWNVLATTEDTAALPQHSSAQVGTIADLPRISKEIENGLSVLLDVRESNEYERSHAAFATLAPLSMLKRLIFPESRDSGVGIELNKMIYVHCQSGKRAQEAAALLTGMRYSNVMALGTTFEEISAAMPTAEGTYETFYEI